MDTEQGTLFDVKKARASTHAQEKRRKKELLVSLARERSPQLFIMLQKTNYSVFEMLSQKEKTEIWQNISDDFDFLIQLIVGNRADVFPNKVFSTEFLSQVWEKLTKKDANFFVRSQIYREGMKQFLVTEKYRRAIMEKLDPDLYRRAVKTIGEK